MSHSKIRNNFVKVSSMNLDPFTGSLFAIVESGNVFALENLLQKADVGLTQIKMYLDQRNDSGCTCIGIAAQEGFLEIAEILINYGATVNEVDFYGQVPLYYAAEYGQLGMANLLIKSGADVSKKDNLSALHIAACRGRTEIAQLLIDAGCDVNAQDINAVNIEGTSTGRTPIFLAVEVEHIGILKALIKRRAKLNHQDTYGMTPLHVACVHNSTAIAKSLILARARLNIADDTENLPIHYAARNGNIQLTQLLIEHGSYIDRLNADFSTALHMAVMTGHVETIKLLVDKGCDVNKCDEVNTMQALHVAVNTYFDVHLFSQVLQLLIQGGCELDGGEYSSLGSPLYRAIDQGKECIGLTLLQHGASASVNCPHDITILQKACRKKQMLIVDTLLYSGDIDWSRESWLYTDCNQCGIDPILVTGYARDVPMTLYRNHNLYYKILEIRHNPLTLLRLCRCYVKRFLGSNLQVKIGNLEIPTRLKHFLMFKIL